MKKHRRKLIPYHIPVNDIVYNKNRRYERECQSLLYFDKSIERSQLLHRCSLQLKHLMNYLFLYKSDSMHYPLTFDNGSPTNNAPMYIIGDSHILSIAWQTIRIPSSDCSMNSYRTLVPLLVTGLKAWHCRQNACFFTNTNLHIILSRIRECRNHVKSVIISAGEIDCREGIGGKRLEGYNESCDKAVENTVETYIDALLSLSVQYKVQLLILPVAPHAYRSGRKGKATGRQLRRERMILWNQCLRREIERRSKGSEANLCHVYFLDYWENLSTNESNEYILKNCYNADFTHMNSAFLPLLEESLKKSGCNIKIL